MKPGDLLVMKPPYGFSDCAVWHSDNPRIGYTLVEPGSIALVLDATHRDSESVKVLVNGIVGLVHTDELDFMPDSPTNPV